LAGILVSGAIPVGASITPAPTVASNTYTIGTGATSSVSVALSSDTASTADTNGNLSTSNYTITFTAPTNLVGGTDSITIEDPTGDTCFPDLASAYTIVDNGGTGGGTATSASVPASGFGAGSCGALTIPETYAPSATVTIPGSSSNVIGAGQTVELIVAGVGNPVTVGTYNLSLYTDTTPVATTSNSYSIIAAATCTGLLSPSAPAAGAQESVAGVTYCSGHMAVAGTLASTDTISWTIPDATLPTLPSYYTATDATTGTSFTPGSVSVSNNGLVNAVVSFSGFAAATGNVIDIQILNVTNPGIAAPPPSTVIDTTTPATTITVAPTYSYTPGVTGITLVTNPVTASVGSTWTTSFKLTTSDPATITLTAPTGTVFPTNAALYTLTDNISHGAAVGIGAVAVAGGPPPTVTITLTNPVDAAGGDTITITILGVTNPAAANYDTSTSTIAGGTAYAVNTSVDTFVATGPPFTIGLPSSAISSLSVIATPATAGAVASYRIGTLSTSAALAAGNTITLEALTAAGVSSTSTSATVWPTTLTDYTIYDVTHPASGGTPTAAAYVSSTGEIQLTLPNAIASGDQLQFLITGVTNPGNGVYTIGVSGSVALVATLATAPNAGIACADRVFVQLTTGAIYNCAGGKAFPVPSIAAYQAIHATFAKGTYPVVVKGTITPSQVTGTATPGTLIQVAGKATIWVVGTTGNVYSFNSPSNFTASGYNPKNVIVVNNLAGLIPASGFAPTAAVTFADDALLQGSKGGVYLMEGGTAFPVTTPTQLASIQQWDKAKIIAGTVTAVNTNQAALHSVLVQVIGTKGVYVIYGGVAYTILSPTILFADGYTWQMVKGIPSLMTIPIVTTTA
jgi:hypothetical protein